MEQETGPAADVATKTFLARRGRAVSAGMRKRAEEGGYPYCAPVGYRNRRNPDGWGFIEPDPETAPLVREAFELAAAGTPVRKIARILEEKGLRSRNGKRMGASSVHAMLRNPVYVGKVAHAGVEVAGKHEPLVSIPSFQTVALALAANRRRGHSVRRVVSMEESASSSTVNSPDETHAKSNAIPRLPQRRIG